MLVICNGMPRSGSTLQYNLVRGIIEKMGKGLGEGFFNPQQARDMFNQFEQWTDESAFHVIKTQSLFSDIELLLQSGNASICYTYRDLRDVAASLERRFKSEGKDLYKVLDTMVKEYYTIQDLPNLVSIRYEEMIGDLEKATRYMAKGLNLSPGPSEIRSVADEFSLASAKKKIQKFELRYKIEEATQKILTTFGINQFMGKVSKKLGIKYTPPFFDPKTLMHAGHIAPKNSHREDFLLPEQIAYITDTYHDWLVNCGYINKT